MENSRFFYYAMALLAPFSALGQALPIKPIIILGGLGILFAFLYFFRHSKSVRKVYIIHLIGLLYLTTYAFLISDDKELIVLFSNLGSPLMVFLVFIIFKDIRQIKKWSYFFAISFGVAALVILAVSFMQPGLRTHFYSFSSDGVRLTGFTENANAYASSLLPVLSILSYILFTSLRKGFKIIIFVLIVAVFISILLTQSRSAVIASLAVPALLLFLTLRNKKQGVKIKSFFWGGIILLIPLLVFLNLSGNFYGLKLARFSEDSKTGMYNVGASSIEDSRFQIYQAAIQVIVNRPFGLGFDRNQEKIVGRETGIYKTPHNFILKTILTYGILGGAYLTILWFLPIFMGIKRIYKGQISKNKLSFFLIMGLTTYLLFSLFHSATNWIYLWLLWGMTLQSIMLESKRKFIKISN